MYRCTTEKKLSTTKRAWKRLISSLQSKLLHCSKSSALAKINHSHLSRWSNAFSCHPHVYHHDDHYNRHYHGKEKQWAQKNIPSVNNKMDQLCIDLVSMDDIHLCPDIERKAERDVLAPNGTASDANNVLITTLTTLTAQQSEKNVEKFDQTVRKNVHKEFVSSIESTFMSLRLHGVDAKSEEFIQRNKEAWRLERQKSAEEYFAMLARGA